MLHTAARAVILRQRSGLVTSLMMSKIKTKSSCELTAKAPEAPVHLNPYTLLSSSRVFLNVQVCQTRRWLCLCCSFWRQRSFLHVTLQPAFAHLFGPHIYVTFSKKPYLTTLLKVLPSLRCSLF